MKHIHASALKINASSTFSLVTFIINIMVSVRKSKQHITSLWSRKWTLISLTLSLKLLCLFPSASSPLRASPAVFMCRLCNLFSPSRSQLLAHCSQLHPQQEPPDDIIIALQPLAGEPVETGQISVSMPGLISQNHVKNHLYILFFIVIIITLTNSGCVGLITIYLRYPVQYFNL